MNRWWLSARRFVCLLAGCVLIQSSCTTIHVDQCPVPCQYPTTPRTETAPESAQSIDPQEGPASGKKGLTWGKVFHDDRLGIDRIHCYGKPALPGDQGGSGCDPYQGDTACSQALPVLCVRVDGSSRPPYAVTCSPYAMPGEYYCGWVGGHISLTPPIRGVDLTSAATADAVCRDYFGDGWRMAEHHDGKWVEKMGEHSYHGDSWPAPDRLLIGGWGFLSYGDVADASRFWVAITDQPANCWN